MEDAAITTFVTMQTRIADELLDSGALSTNQIKNAILTAVKHYERKAWWFNQKVGTFSTVAAQELYTSSDLADIPKIVIIESMLMGSSSTTKAPLRPLDNFNIDELQDGSVTGDPEFYARFADKIRLYPIPSAVRTMTVSYVYKLTALSADGDTNAWTDECEELIRQSAKRILATDIIHDDDLANRFGQLEQICLDNLRNEYRTRMSQGISRVEWPFGGYSTENWRN